MGMDPQFATIPAEGIVSITPSDTTVINVRGVYVGGTGDVAVTMLDGSTGTYKAVPVGIKVVGRISKVMATGTTATNLIGEK